MAESSVPVPGSKERRDSLLRTQAGILVTEDLEKAVAHCRDKVQRLAKECRDGNRKYRDLEFDLLEDKERCLHRLGYNRQNPRYQPADVRRATEMVKNPKFFVDDATASDICQGKLGDCWFLSALAVVATTTEVVDRICVERDEEVGIYGFIFWRDFGWAEVIIDDLLCTQIRPWNNLPLADRAMFRHDKATYNARARQGLFENLYFAKSRTDNETWVPLIEKAYAKLHGDYESLESGFTSEGVEDLTGGVSTIIYRRDILDTEKFWKEELRNVGTDRLFACFTPGTTPGASEKDLTALEGDEHEGLIPGHAYSIIKAIDFESENPPGSDKPTHKGKYLRIRNPWGRKEWSGPWSDGSEQWNEPWADQLRKKLGDGDDHPYKFGDDGEFVQNYDDFLDCWEIIERSRLFGEDWNMSSQWLTMPPDAHLTPWSLGDLSFTVDIVSKSSATGPEETVIVLAQRDKRYFRELAGPYLWSMDFVLYRRGEKLPMTRSVHSTLWDRSVKLEVKLAPGRYIIHARLDCKLKDPPADLPDWRKRNRKQMALAASSIIATNCHDHSLLSQHLTLPPNELAGSDLGEIELRAHLEATRSRKSTEKLLSRKGVTVDIKTPEHQHTTSSSDLLTPATKGGTVSNELFQYQIERPTATRSDSDTQGTDGTYGQGIPRAESPAPYQDQNDPGTSHAEKQYRSHSYPSRTTHYYTPSSTLSSGAGSQGEGPSPGSSPKSRRGESTPKLGGCVSNSTPLPTVKETEVAPQEDQNAQANTQSFTGSGHKSNVPAHPTHTIDFQDEQLQSLPSKCHSYFHEKHICRGCEKQIKGPMIHCIDIACHDLNLCLHCKDIPIHPKDHQVIISVCAEDDVAIHHTFTSSSISDATSTTDKKTAHDNLPPSDLLLGLRVYTRSPYKAKVKGQLRTGSLLRNHYFTPKPSGILDGHQRTESEINHPDNQSTT
ncbi:hypothetical protein FRC01_014808 [Tulasnella sp. 417]|nr:hypothetical protein FRC01_014808 [Tulasnella sp. 417]